MRNKAQAGSVATIILIGVLSVVLIASIGFGYWAYSGRQDYKNNSDKKSAAAVAAAKDAQKAELQKVFDEQAKLPYKTYTGSSTYGSINFNYPKTWSGYVDEASSNEPINGYFHPNIVPGVQSKAAFALRIELVDMAYADVVSDHTSQVQDGTAKAVAYIPPKMVGVANVQPGVRVDGAIASDQQGSMVIVKVRDKTLQIYTLGGDFINDFNNVVLPSLTFAP